MRKARCSSFGLVIDIARPVCFEIGLVLQRFVAFQQPPLGKHSYLVHACHQPKTGFGTCRHLGMARCMNLGLSL